MTTVELKKENSFSLVRLLFIVIWTQSTIMPYVAQIFRRIPLIGQFYTSFIPALIFALFFLSFNKLIRKVKISDIIFIFVFVIAIIWTMVFFPKNSEYIREDASRIFFSALPMYIWGVCYDHELLKRDLYIYSVAGLVISFLYLLFFLSTREMGYGYDMSAAYGILPNALYTVYWAFEKKKIRYWAVALFSLFYVLLYGTRGPLLVFVLYFCVCLFFNIAKGKSVTKIILLIVIAFLVVSAASGSLIVSFVENISEFFEEMGFSTRILDKFLEGDISEDSGRSTIYAQIKEAINENWLFGLGIMGDRTVLYGAYAHNLFLEIFCSFGILAGGAVILALLSLAFNALKKTYAQTEFQFLLLFVTLAFTKLMVSSSFVAEPYFYFMLGLCVSLIRKYGKKKHYISNTMIVTEHKNKL